MKHDYSRQIHRTIQGCPQIIDQFLSYLYSAKPSRETDVQKTLLLFKKNMNLYNPKIWISRKTLYRSCTSITEDIRSTLGNMRCYCGIFIDIQKAFDTVNHEIMLRKLEHYDIRGNTLRRFNSHLSDRAQFVSINGHDSTKTEISCGDPQGSVLSPILFPIFIIDLLNVSNNTKLYHIADDTNIYAEYETIRDLVQIASMELKSV